MVVSTPNLDNVYTRFWYALTGRLYNLMEGSYRTLGHVSPVYLWNLERMIEGKFSLEAVTVNASPVPRTRLQLPTKSRSLWSMHCREASPAAWTAGRGGTRLGRLEDRSNEHLSEVWTPRPAAIATRSLCLRVSQVHNLESRAKATLGGSPKGGGRSPRSVVSAARELSWRPGSPPPRTERSV